ncbi:MAG: OmpA family protein [Gammaproteobacteria bacterium]|nr:OmpA family protein [Gammaproteobacteria bacterium]
MRHVHLKKIIALAVAVTLAGCAADDPNKRAKTGAAIGAVAGAVLGHQLDSRSGRYVGAAVGALTGAAVGNYMDKQQQEFDSALAEEQRQNTVNMQRMQDDSLKIDISNEVSFDFARAEIKSSFRPTLDKVGDVLKRYPNSIVHVVGHTDSVGSDAYNQRLSEQRAQSVVDYLASIGVARERLRAEGRGETEPRDTNATEAGRQLNRRVELYVKPIVEGQEQHANEPPPVQNAPASWR